MRSRISSISFSRPGRDQHRNRVANRFSCGVTINSLRRPVPTGDDAIERGTDDGVIGIFNDGGQFPQPAFNLMAIWFVMRDTHATHIVFVLIFLSIRQFVPRIPGVPTKTMHKAESVCDRSVLIAVKFVISFGSPNQACANADFFEDFSGVFIFLCYIPALLTNRI